MDGLTCRHCGRPIVVAASNCPWCGKPVMVICANCKAYTDDQKPVCEQCGAPLEVDRMERLALLAHHPDIAQMVDDQVKAQLVASAVVVNNLGDFFYDDGQGHRTVLVELAGPARDRKAVAAGVVFAAYAYVFQRGYCAVELTSEEDEEQGIMVDQVRPWDGQHCIERALVAEAARTSTTREATDEALRELMGFRVAVVRGDSLSVPKPHDGSERSALAAIDQAARLTVLPDHDRQEACRATYRLLMEFVEANRERARLLTLETLQLLDWFERYERDPSIGLKW